MSKLRTAAAVVGFVLHIAIGSFPFAATGLLAPPWAVAVVALWWSGLLALMIVWFRRGHRLRVAIGPLVALAGWVALLTLGDELLGWTA